MIPRPMIPRIRSIETGGETLVDDGDAAFVYLSVCHDVTLRTFADGDDMIGLVDSLTELPCVDLCVEPVVKFWMAQENEVVDSDHTLDATLTDAEG